MYNKLNEIKADFDEAITKVQSKDELEQLRINYLGKKGIVTELLKGLKNLDAAEKKVAGKEVNLVKNSIEEALITNGKRIEEEALLNSIASAEKFDYSIPSKLNTGSLHPITIIQRQIEDIFKSMGFIIEDGLEVQTEYNNFEAVNIPKHHPARDMQDTYYLENGQLLKTHTSAAQNAIMKKYGAPKPGETLKVLFPGRCFRNENIDACHENTFFQMEGMMIGENISISNLIYFMKVLLSEVFQRDVKVRLRPGFFPFVEPGFELDVNCLICGGEGCSTCKQSGWLELLPCGMIHPNVLEMGGIDSDKYTGFAFGLGLTRLAMMKYEIKDIRVFNSANLKALKQFSKK
ncbi:phenylalanine--tRNA ligase subunit alpha [Anaeromicropila populeti]|uniref:Phenylalanine--tRNA ligase alpha subunit n=1 Tax=Anaeromicropila populeti TaxID=37658 RepID=A0A1I6IE20_9FIRM|nr:phenylalanine--tRNA ligase subunit alpha [Anaeromicropila populeti]SFR64948.1 phenylalanyl-tRNA synthetase, alpha subunit [Anaeromicropila populeti]